MGRASVFAGYAPFLASLKERVLAARIAAVRSVHRELVLLYWDIGRRIVEKQEAAGWGDAVVPRLAEDLRAVFPDMRGFSPPNVWRMQRLYRVHTSPEFLAHAKKVLRPRRRGASREILSQAVRELVAAVPWGHHANLLMRLNDPAARLFYLRAVAQFGWSRNLLLTQINADAFARSVTDPKTHNFALALPSAFAEQADEMMKSRYHLEFPGIARPVKERELGDRLIERLQQFLLELGYGFCFLGPQYRLALGRKEYFVDLLFYQRFLRALVAFDLKLGAFLPEHAGKMDFYLNLLNEQQRAPGDSPSIGIILCAEKDDIEVEFALKSKNNPIGVAEYRLQARLPAELKGRLPTARQLADAVRGLLPDRPRTSGRARAVVAGRGFGNSLRLPC